jgi:hypothetical protein
VLRLTFFLPARCIDAFAHRTLDAPPLTARNRHAGFSMSKQPLLWCAIDEGDANRKLTRRSLPSQIVRNQENGYR